MIVTLTVIKGEDTGKSFRLTDGEAKTIGRSSQADIILQDVGVSRHHCNIRVEGGKVIARDLDSRNGTFVCGREIREPAKIYDGDQIGISMSVLKVRVQEVIATAETQTGDASETSTPKPETAPAEPASDDSGPLRSSLMGAFEEYLDEPTVERSRPPETAPPAAGEEEQAGTPPDDLVGRIIAGCRVESLIGRGPISYVYRGTQVSMDRPVSLKILLPEMTHDEAAVNRFIRGARAGGRLNHPNIVQVFDAGEEGGFYFIALELVDGKSVRELVAAQRNRRGLDPDTATLIASQICEALAHAHDQGFIHRHIGPDSILVTRHGIAKLANLGTLQGVRDMLMTPATAESADTLLPFCAPEVLRDPDSAGPLSDLYSLGAVLFLMITGRPPFTGRDADEIRERILTGRREPFRKMPRGTPDALPTIIESALKPELDRRPQSAEDFERELRHVRELLR